MSEFPEKDINKKEPETAPSSDNQNSCESGNSTIFVKHTYSTKKPTKNGTGKRIAICCVSLLICAVIGTSAFILNKYLPDTDSSSSGISASSLPDDTYEILKYDNIVKPFEISINGKTVSVDNNIESIKFFNFSGEFSFIPYFTKNDDYKEGTESGKNAYKYKTNWQIEGLDKELTLSSSIESRIRECLNVKGFLKMPNDFDTIEEYHNFYGMNDKLNAGVVCRFADGTEDLVITVGKALVTGDAYYFKTSLSDTVYGIKSSFAEKFINCTAKEFANPNIIKPLTKNDESSKYYTKEALSKFDSIKIYGEVFNDKVYEFKMSQGISADYMPYSMTEPYQRPANDAFISKILDFAGKGLDASTLYSYKVTEQDKKECGLDKPKCLVEVKIGSYNFKLIIGGTRNDETGSMAAMVEGKQQVFGVAEEKLQFLIAASNNESVMFNPNFILEDIYTIKNVEFKTSSLHCKFDLKHTEQEDKKGVYDTEVKYNGKVMDTASFKRLYQRVLMMSLVEFVTDAPKTEPVLTVKFNYIGDTKPRVVEFTQSPDDLYHYVAWVDGTPLGEVLKSSLTNITDCLDLFLAGKEVPDTW